MVTATKDWLQKKHKNTLWTVKSCPKARWWKDEPLYKYLLNKSTSRLPLCSRSLSMTGVMPGVDLLQPQILRAGRYLADQRADCTGRSLGASYPERPSFLRPSYSAAEGNPQRSCPKYTSHSVTTKAWACCLPPAATNPEVDETLLGPGGHPGCDAESQYAGRSGGESIWLEVLVGAQLLSKLPASWARGEQGVALSSSPAQRAPC